MKKYLAFLVVFLGTACTTTLNPTPTPEPTPIPLSEVKLESLLIVEGDLPEDLIPDAITNENAVGSADELDRAVVVYTQYMLLNDGEGGGVSVFLFESLDDVQDAFYKVTTFMNAPIPYRAVGENARIENFLIPVMPDIQPIEGARLIFSRCHALVVIQFPRAGDFETMEIYGKSLDTRIQPHVCRKK